MTSPDSGSRKALGRGLAALMPSTRASAVAGLRNLPIEKIHPNPKQPRKHFDADKLDELAASIREQGVLQPVIVRRAADDGYELIAGERRWRAAGRAGYQEIPALIKDCSDRDALKVSLVENVQREDLDPLEEAEAYSRLVREHGLTQEEVGQAVGRSRSAITNAMRLLKLPEKILAMLADGRLTAGHARALMTLKDDRDQLELAIELNKRGASVREAEARARMLNRSKGKIEKPKKTAADMSLEERLMRALQTKVRLHHNNGKGHLEIFFHSYAHLDGILERLER